MRWKDPRTVFAFLLLGIVARLAFAIAVGNVQEQTSYGLHELLLLLTVIGTKVVDSIFGNGGPKPPSPS